MTAKHNAGDTGIDPAMRRRHVFDLVGYYGDREMGNEVAICAHPTCHAYRVWQKDKPVVFSSLRRLQKAVGVVTFI